MSTGPKAGAAHPDENRLAAFAERALQADEHHAVLAHLADCARCREIVFLAREAARGSELAPDKVARPISAWRRWQTAVTAGAAAALIGAALLVWQGRRPSAPAESREAASAVALPDKAPNPAIPRAKAPPLTKPGPAAHPSGTAIKTELEARNRRKRAASEQAPELASRRPSAPPLSNERGAGSNVASGVVPPEPSVAPVPAPSVTAQRASPSAARSGSAAAGETDRLAMSAEASGSDENAVGSLSPPGKSAPQFVVVNGELRRGSRSGFQALRLPNGTKARAVASGADIVLVLSRSRKVYRSTDSGEHWTEVPAQWQGKASRLEAASVTPYLSSPARQLFAGQAGSGGAPQQAAPPPSTPNTATNAPEVSAAAAQPQTLADRLASARVTFLLTNSAGKRWISHDGGQTWLPE